MIADKNCEKLINVLEKADFEAYAVGGSVRDFLMGKPTNDYDITTSATPNEVERVLNANGIRYVETGIKHGTVSAILDGIAYEITTFRTETGYSDNRHPDKVKFVTNLADDLSRRDFTINAMAYNSRCGIVDLFGGREDLENKLIRTVGNPDTRFNEDALRILRALRFSSTLDFDIEDKTSDSILKNAHLLSNVADERITTETLKMIDGKRFDKLCEKYPSVMTLIFGVDFKKYKKQALLVQNTPDKIIYLLASLYKEKFEKNAQLGRLKLPSATVKRVILLLENIDFELKADKTLLKLAMYEKGLQTVKDIAIFHQQKEILCLIDEIETANEPYLIAHLDVTGKDIMALGYKGEQIGIMLDKILRLVINGQIQNKKEDIIKKGW